MTSRERIIEAFTHRKMKHFPVDFGGHRSSGISAMLYPKLRRLLGLPERPVFVYDLIQQLAVIDEDVLDVFGVDTIELGRGFSLSEDSWAPWVLPDGTPCYVPSWSVPERGDRRWVLRSPSGRIFAEMVDGAQYFEQAWYPFFDRDDMEAIPEALRESMWTQISAPPGPDVSARELAEGARNLREDSSRAIIGLFGGNLFEIGQFLYRSDKFLMMLAAEPVQAAEFLDRLTAYHLNNLEAYLGAVGKHIDIILFGDDLGMQTGPQMSPDMYRSLFKPRHKTLWQAAKEMAGIKVMLHCCGGVRELLPDLIEAGLDAINPVQIRALGMEPAGLKADFGSHIVFWGGGCDTQEVLPSWHPSDIAAHVRENTNHFQKNGGFVFQQVHNILSNVPAPNVAAMFREVNRLRGIGEQFR